MSVAEPAGLYFLDTNIFVYSFDATEPVKQQTARQIVQAALRTQRGVISTQVAQEFLNLALRKFARPMTVSEAREYLTTVLLPLCRHFPSAAFYDRALLLKEETGYSWYDTLIVAAAVEAGCTTLLSEDMQSGRAVRGVMIRNPFAP
jgi:predicted nucleic acid-binding protein